MKSIRHSTAKNALSDAQTISMQALETYQKVLDNLTKSGASRKKQARPALKLPYVDTVEGLENLYLSLSSVAPAQPAAVDEEWNPLSQRPHAPLPPPVGGELGLEITGLKEAIDAFTTLSHEMMHVALWEPFFAGKWRPRSRRQFRNFSLMAEGYCFFFSDIIVAGLVRVRFPDGEFALSRQTPSNALFPPIRAFQALGIVEHDDILDIYLEGFTGKKTQLLQPRGTSNFVEALAARIYHFYSGTVGYLDRMYEALSEIGALDEFYHRFCNLPGLPSFLSETDARLASERDFKPYFKAYFQSGQKQLEQLSAGAIDRIRWRRMLQSRAYYVMQVRWYLREGLIIAERWRPDVSRRLLSDVEDYLSELAALLSELGHKPSRSPLPKLSALDLSYDTHVRQILLKHKVWAGHRWLIVPTRAGGLVSVFDDNKLDERATKIKILRTVAFIVDELTRNMKASQTIEQRTAVLAEIQRIAAIGARCGDGRDKNLKAATKALRVALKRPLVRDTWSLPLSALDPSNNLFRELAFSYQ